MGAYSSTKHETLARKLIEPKVGGGPTFRSGPSFAYMPRLIIGFAYCSVHVYMGHDNVNFVE